MFVASSESVNILSDLRLVLSLKLNEAQKFKGEIGECIKGFGAEAPHQNLECTNI